MQADTSPRRRPKSEDILREWARHWPFERASADLIKRAQKHVREQRNAPPNAPRAML